MMTRLILGISVALVAASCGGDPETEGSRAGAESTPAAESTGSPAAEPAGVPTTVEVEMADFSVEPVVSEAPAGTLTFEPTIVDGSEGHNFVVVKTDLAPDALPTTPSGAANTTTGEGVELLGFLATFTPQDSPTLEVNAAPGEYVLICNIVDHYRRGMAAPFTVA